MFLSYSAFSLLLGSVLQAGEAPDGTQLRPDVTVLKPDVTKLRPDVTKLRPNVTKVRLDVTVLRPMVPTGCETVCGGLFGCWVCRYLVVDLSCHLSNHTEDLDRVSKHKDGIERTEHVCSQYEYTSSQVNTTCLVKTEDSSHSEGKGNISRLLIVPIKTKTGAKQFFIGNNTIADHPALYSSGINGVAYIFKVGKVFMTTTSPFQQVLARLGSSDVEIIGEKAIHTAHMVVDEMKMIIFIKSNIPKRCIQRLTIQERHFETIIVLRVSTGRIALDTGSSTLFLAVVGTGVAKYNYSGSFGGYLLKANVFYSLTFDKSSRVLYYSHRSGVSICKYDMRSKTQDYVKYLGFLTELFLFEQNAFYIHECPGGQKGRIMVMNEIGDSTSVNTDESCHVEIIAVP